MGITAVDKSKVKFFDYFFMFCMVIYAGSATVFARSLGNVSTIGNAFGLILTLILFVKGNLKITRNYLKIIVVFSCFAVITFIRNGMINPLWYSQWIIRLTIASCICLYYKENLFVCYETVLFHLSIVGIAFWSVQLFFPDLIYSIVRAFEFSRPYTEDGNVAMNMIVYTIGVDGRQTSDYSSLIRNPGFAWEPGAFSCLICLALFCNVLRTNFKFKRNFPLFVFMIALLSTQSTTGLSMFAIMLLLWLIFNKKFSYAFLVLPLAVFLVSQEFVMGKFLDEYGALDNRDWKDASSAVGRLASFQLEWQEFMRHPLIGLGGYEGGTWLKLHGYDVVTISGIGDLLSRYGAIMSLLFLALLFKSARTMSDFCENKNGFLLIVVVIAMMISYGLWKQPIYIAFWAYCCFSNKKDLVLHNAASPIKSIDIIE